MTTSTINHRHASYAAAVTGLVGALLAITVNSANAMPGRDDHPTVPPSPSTGVHTSGHYVGHGCFITPQTWSEAVAGPMPVCYTYVP